MKTLTQTAEFILIHDEENGWLYINWRGRQPQQSIFEACALILSYVRRTGCPKILSDSTQDEDGWGKLVQWIATNYFKSLAGEGVKAVAWVLPVNLRARTDVQNVVNSIRHVVADVFTDTEEAYRWLSRLPLPKEKS